LKRINWSCRIGAKLVGLVLIAIPCSNMPGSKSLSVA
jgi:hypothetical protein